MTYAVVSMLVYLAPFAFAAAAILLLAGACAWMGKLQNDRREEGKEFEFSVFPPENSREFAGSHGFHVVGFLHRRR